MKDGRVTPEVTQLTSDDITPWLFSSRQNFCGKYVRVSDATSCIHHLQVMGTLPLLYTIFQEKGNNLPYFFDYKTEFFPSKTIPKI